MGQTEEDIRHKSKQEDFVCEELSRKRKLKEQLNLPSPKYKFKTKLNNSERQSPLLDPCTSKDDDSSRSLDHVKQPESDGAFLEVNIGNDRTMLASNIGKVDAKTDTKPSENNKERIAREIGDENVMLSGSINTPKSSKISLQFNLVSMDKRQATGYTCGFESSKHISCEASCSYNQFFSRSVNMSCKFPGEQSCSSPDVSTNFGVGLEPSDHSMHYLGRKATKKRTPSDLERQHINLKDLNHKEDNLYAHESYLDHNQSRRSLGRVVTPQAEENEVNILTLDGVETDSLESIVSAYKPPMVKRPKSVNTASSTLEFGSGIISDAHKTHLREEAQLGALADTDSSVETGTSQNSVVYNSQNISSPYGHMEGSTTSTEIYEELDANYELYSEIQIPSNDIKAKTTEAMPIYVLSSGRTSRQEELHKDSRPLTIDQDFEQYFSMLML